MSIRRGTTPAVALLIDEDLSEWPTVLVSMRGPHGITDFDKERIEFLEAEDMSSQRCCCAQLPIHIIRIELTQEETLAMRGRVDVQVRAVDDEGHAVASTIKTVRSSDVINQEVLT